MINFKQAVLLHNPLDELLRISEHNAMAEQDAKFLELS
jgi:hypothetical protein